MGGKHTESCGRCSVSTVVDAAGNGDDDQGAGSDPFDGERIELDEDRLRSVVRHEVFVQRVESRLDDLATRLIYG